MQNKEVLVLDWVAEVTKAGGSSRAEVVRTHLVGKLSPACWYPVRQVGN